MASSKLKRYTVLSILFFLPVLFLLMLIPAKHNYNALDIVESGLSELEVVNDTKENAIRLKDHITVLGFLGKNPLANMIAVSNLKELIYDKFKGFKRFQVVLIASEGTEDEVATLEKEIRSYEDLRFFHIVYAKPSATFKVFNQLKSKSSLDENLSTYEVFIIDQELNQRGRIEDEDVKKEDILNGKIAVPSYNTIEVSELKNKMSEDMRVLFTEYRQKRKGDFNSTIRRAEDLKE